LLHSHEVQSKPKNLKISWIPSTTRVSNLYDTKLSVTLEKHQKENLIIFLDEKSMKKLTKLLEKAHKKISSKVHFQTQSHNWKTLKLTRTAKVSKSFMKVSLEKFSHAKINFVLNFSCK
jgi:hypothetical protein